ncbi:peptidoglycan-binding protein [Kitasatospora sp. NPDC057198]|uniref:peptidoglycan-binding protein n=1 Tax=Kitasatospora sp. NPDC057198 TaxID=3346046 RepID=UPI003642E807
MEQHPDETTGREHGSGSRRRWVVGIAVGAVLLTGAGIGAAAFVKSPAQVAADSAPPPPDVLTAQVERRVLKDSVILRGTVVAGQSVEVAPVVSGAAGGAVVTRLPLPAGSPVEQGRLLAEVSGRPVFALQGALPVYRDLKPGVTGDDVAQLQQALAALGHRSGGDRPGVYGAGTKAAVTAFYRSLGYDPLPAAADGGAALKAAEQAVTQGERAVQDATDARAAAPAGDRAAQRALDRAGQDLADARKALAELRAADGPMVPAAELVFLSGFPARVDGVAVKVGSRVSGTVLTVSAGALEVRGSLLAYQKGLVRPGQRVEIVSEVSGVQASAKVLSVADQPGQPAPAAQDGGAQGGTAQGVGQGVGQGVPGGYPMVVQPDGPLDGRLAGQDVRLTVEAAATDGPVLVVPVTAVTAGADGRTTLAVLEPDGRRRTVPVRTGTTGDGYVEVAPEGGAALAEGERVVTGVRKGSRP